LNLIISIEHRPGHGIYKELQFSIQRFQRYALNRKNRVGNEPLLAIALIVQGEEEIPVAAICQ